jgi:hypothetical protein
MELLEIDDVPDYLKDNIYPYPDVFYTDIKLSQSCSEIRENMLNCTIITKSKKQPFQRIVVDDYPVTIQRG